MNGFKITSESASLAKCSKEFDSYTGIDMTAKNKDSKTEEMAHHPVQRCGSLVCFFSSFWTAMELYDKEESDISGTGCIASSRL